LHSSELLHAADIAVRRSKTEPASVAQTVGKTLLVVGPQPPPVGGATATVQAFLDELARRDSVRCVVINTSPPPDYRVKTALLKLDTLARAATIVRQFVNAIGSSDAALIFGTNSFVFTLGTVLLMLGRWRRKPCFVRLFGGDLDLWLQTQGNLRRKFSLWVLGAADGFLVETRLVYEALARLGCSKTHYVPGYREPRPVKRLERQHAEHLRLVFLSQIRRGKGPLVLLEALQRLVVEGGSRITCDFYGPLIEDCRAEFLTQLSVTPGACYRGVVESSMARDLLARYDALVLPTDIMTEGHPGVIIEAMQAGIPVITTRHRAVPELITDGVNGLLVPVRDSMALAKAITELAADRLLREQMGQANRDRGSEFSTDVVVERMLNMVLPECAPNGGRIVH